MALEEAGRKGQVKCLLGQAHLYEQAAALGMGRSCSALKAASVENVEG